MTKALHSLEKALLERQLITRDDLEEAGLAEVDED